MRSMFPCVDYLPHLSAPYRRDHAALNLHYTAVLAAPDGRSTVAGTVVFTRAVPGMEPCPRSGTPAGIRTPVNG
jgi:hypothetical protein